MTSVVPRGAADRIAARILFKVPRAGCGTRARYSVTFLGAPLPFAAERSLPDFAFFMPAMLQESFNASLCLGPARTRSTSKMQELSGHGLNKVDKVAAGRFETRLG